MLLKYRSLEILPYVPYLVGFLTMLILTQNGMAFHATVATCLIFELLLKSALSILCLRSLTFFEENRFSFRMIAFSFIFIF